MSTTADGTVRCDRCARPLGIGGLDVAVVIGDLDYTTGQPVQYHLCRAYLDDAGNKVSGCNTRVLTDAALRVLADEGRKPQSEPQHLRKPGHRPEQTTPAERAMTAAAPPAGNGNPAADATRRESERLAKADQERVEKERAARGGDRPAPVRPEPGRPTT